jgi:Protein of unknown function (DUF2510)/zinc-ribbon family
MIIIFGLRRLRKGLGPVMLRCANCGASPLVLFRISTWFALFFIPMIPISFKHYTACPNCRRIEDVSKVQVENARAQAEALRAAGQGSATPSVPAGAVVPAPAPAPAATLESAVSQWAAVDQPHGATVDGKSSERIVVDDLDAAPASPPAYPEPKAPAGWFPDPSEAGVLRYWDGRQWTGHTTPTSGPG